MAIKKVEENSNEKVDIKKVNEVVNLSRNFLKLACILLIVCAIYAIIIITKEINILPFIIKIIKIVAPLFIGIIAAWLFDPIVRWLSKKGVRRSIGAGFVYFTFIVIITIVIWAIIPMLSEQINELSKTIPQIFDTIKGWINDLFDKIGNIGNFDVASMRIDLFKRIEEFGTSLANSLPEISVNILKGFFSGLGTFLVGLIIGFYLLISFNNANDTIIALFPKKMHKDVLAVLDKINFSLRKFVEGALIDCTAVFIITALGLWIAGLKSPILFGLFCGLTNVIPYAGPYIGGAPAVIVGFVQSPITGVLTLIVIAVIQFLEGNFIQPLIMSKTTKLNPVTIMLGLLVFGYFWGIIGMIVSTPIIASLKAIFNYFNEKYNLVRWG